MGRTNRETDMRNKTWLLYLIIPCLLYCWVSYPIPRPMGVSQGVVQGVEPTWSTLYPGLEQKVLVVTVLKQGNWGEVEVTGTGILIRSGVVLTCNHVVDRGKSIKVNGIPATLIKGESCSGYGSAEGLHTGDSSYPHPPDSSSWGRGNGDRESYGLLSYRDHWSCEWNR